MTTTVLENKELMNNEMVAELRSQLNNDFENIMSKFMNDLNTMEEEKKKQLKTIDRQMTLSEFVKEKRKENGYTLQTLSEMINCSVVYLHQIEKGKCKNISMRVFRDICKSLNYSADNLLEYLIFEDKEDKEDKEETVK